MLRTRMTAAIVVVALLGLGAAAPTASSKAAHHRAHAAKPDSTLMAQAKVKEEDARKTALAQVPGGKVKSWEIERENGKLIYSYAIRVQGKSGVEEINIDAMDGTVVSKEHESPKAERDEARREKAAPKDSTKTGK